MATKRTQWGMVQSFADVIDKFDGPAAFAREVGMSAGAAKQAKRRNSISAEWFEAIDKAARRRGLQEVNLRTLAELAKLKRLERLAS